MTAYCFFSFGADGDCLVQAIRALRLSDPTGKIAVFDDGNAPLAEVQVDHYERTFFERRVNLNGRECIMGEIAAFSKAARMFGAEFVAKVDSDTVVLDPHKAVRLMREGGLDLLGSSWHDDGVWGPFYLLRASVLPRMAEAVMRIKDLCDEEDMGMTHVCREAKGRVRIIYFKDPSERVLSGLDYRLRDFDLMKFSNRCAVTCGNRMQIKGPDPRAVCARAMAGLVGLFFEGKSWDWAAVLEGHKVYDSMEQQPVARPKKKRKGAKDAEAVGRAVEGAEAVEIVDRVHRPLPEVPASIGEPHDWDDVGSWVLPSGGCTVAVGQIWPEAVVSVESWVAVQDSPALVICDGTAEPHLKEHLAALVRDGKVIIKAEPVPTPRRAVKTTNDYHNAGAISLKFAALHQALQHWQDAVFFDADVVFLSPLLVRPVAVDVMLSEHLSIAKHHAPKCGTFNAGLLWTKDCRFPEWWRSMYERGEGGFYEQGLLDKAQEAYAVGVLDRKHNWGYWRGEDIPSDVGSLHGHLLPSLMSPSGGVRTAALAFRERMLAVAGVERWLERIAEL
jgi:hypothetical protein